MTYEFNGNQYKKASLHQTRWGENIVECLPFKGTEHVMDIGCGDGRVTQKLALRVPNGNVLGIDSSKGMISAAKQIESDNLQFMVLEANKLSFHEQFDVVFSHAALHWVKDHGTLLQKIYDAMRPGGYAKLNFAGNGTCQTLIDVIREAMGHEAYKKYFMDFEWPWYMPNLVEYQNVLSRSPFQDIEVEQDFKERLFPSDDPLIKWIDHPCLVPFLEVIDEKDKNRFRTTVINQMLQKTRQAEGKYLEKFNRIDVLLKK